MRLPLATPTTTKLPTFEEARNRRQKARAAGLDPDYWYAVEPEAALRPGQVRAVTFWGQRIALFRTSAGALAAVQDRCAHRLVPLSLGTVDGEHLVCPYHGWSYDAKGQLARISHDLFGRPFPKVALRSYPVQVRYGLIWLFPGDPALAAGRAPPEIPELEGPDRWACVPLDYTWRAHHSLVIDNVSDFAHAYLHRRYRPFTDAKLTRHALEGERVTLAYDTQVGGGAISGLFVDRRRVDTSSMELAYEYPYQRSDTGGKIKHWLFVLPIDERTTRCFFLFYFESFRVPFTPLRVPRPLMEPILEVANRLMIGPLLEQDGWILEAEQAAYERTPDAPMIELNPAVSLFQELTTRKWAEHLARARAEPPAPARCEADVAATAPAVSP